MCSAKSLGTLLALAVGVSGLAACQSLRDAAGLSKKSPDEFAVTTKAPLVIPPDFNLRPPMPGAPPTNQLDPSANAQEALFSSVDPQMEASRIVGNFTPGERMLLAHAGVQNSDPGIRARLNADQRAAMQNADESFTDRILGSAATPDTGRPVNADAEVARRSGTKSSAPKKNSGGWFDWL